MRRPFPSPLAEGVFTCPAHDDHTPSLSVTQDPTGVWRLHCFAGCDRDAILRAADLDWTALYPGQRAPVRSRPIDDSVTDILMLAKQQQRQHRERVRPWVIRHVVADRIRELARLATRARELAREIFARDGEGSDGAWALLEAAADFEREAMDLEQALDG